MEENNKSIDSGKNQVFIGAIDKLIEWKTNPDVKIKGLLKNYLELDNVSFLFGAGSSINLGSTSIAFIPSIIEDAIKNYKNKDGKEEKDVYKEFLQIVKQLQSVKSIEEINRNGTNIKYELEKLLDYLTALSFIQERDKSVIAFNYVNLIISIIKKEVFELCDLISLPNKEKIEEEVQKNLSNNKFHYHERFVKKILQRPLNLRRANIFTTNYDLAFEYAFDNLGVKYIDGFSGFNNRTFKPETFDHDIFYPGSTTQGRVHRIEKVIKYFKLHGSLTWKFEKNSPENIYGIKEYPIDYVREKKKEGATFFSDLMIYPTATKKTYTLDYPYSELFRQFANSIVQPQSVLITYGYSFSDEHINDIIYQALSIPTFTLLIVDFLGTAGSKEINRLKELDDPRIVIIQGEQLGNFPFFVQNILPDLVEINNEQKLANTLKNLYYDGENEKEPKPQ